MSKHGVWKHATREELEIQEEIGACVNELKTLLNQVSNLFDSLNSLKRRCEGAQIRFFHACNELSDRVRERHKECKTEPDGDVGPLMT